MPYHVDRGPNGTPEHEWYEPSDDEEAQAVRAPEEAAKEPGVGEKRIREAIADRSKKATRKKRMWTLAHDALQLFKDAEAEYEEARQRVVQLKAECEG